MRGLVAVVLLTLVFTCIKAAVHEGDRNVLVNFYHGLESKGTLPWDVVHHTCGLQGIHCDNSEPQRVINIFLYALEMAGTIPTEFGLLTELQALVISGNYFVGTLPTELGALPKLNQLWVRDNRLDGVVPPEVLNSQIQVLYLAGNYFDCPSPDYSDLRFSGFISQDSDLFTSQCESACGQTPCAVNETCSLRHYGQYACDGINPSPGNTISPIPMFFLTIMSVYFFVQAILLN